MIAAEPHSPGGQKEAHAQGWIISVLLHGTVAFTALLLVKQVQLTPQNEAFKWNVALVSPAPQVQSTTSTHNGAPTPSGPQTISAPSLSAQQMTPAQTLSSPHPPAQQTTPPISERAAAPEIPEPPTAQPTPSSLLTAHTTQSAEPIAQETMASMAAEPSSIVKPVDASTAASAESDTMVSQSGPAVQMAAISQAPSNPPAKRDYGWLSESILRRLEELKRYPASARMDRAEGKVVVKAVINEDGSLGEVEVFQSSGHLGLDKAALETLRQAAPFQLSRPLGKPDMTIKIPMSYRLDR